MSGWYRSFEPPSEIASQQTGRAVRALKENVCLWQLHYWRLQLPLDASQTASPQLPICFPELSLCAAVDMARGEPPSGCRRARDVAYSKGGRNHIAIQNDQKIMKSILLVVCVFTLLTTVGCIFPGHRGGGDYRDHEYRGHERYRGNEEYREHSGYQNRYEPGVDVRIHAD